MGKLILHHYGLDLGLTALLHVHDVQPNWRNLQQVTVKVMSALILEVKEMMMLPR